MEQVNDLAQAAKAVAGLGFAPGHMQLLTSAMEPIRGKDLSTFGKFGKVLAERLEEGIVELENYARTLDGGKAQDIEVLFFWTDAYASLNSLDKFVEGLRKISSFLLKTSMLESEMNAVLQVLNQASDEAFAAEDYGIVLETMKQKLESAPEKLKKSKACTVLLGKLAGAEKKAKDARAALKSCAVELDELSSVIMTELETKIFTMDNSKVELGEMIGKGSFGTVYAGMNDTRPVALKALTNLALRKSIAREHGNLATISHENVIRIFGITVLKETMYIVMERATHSLESLLHRPTDPVVLDVSKLGDFIRNIWSGLSFLHGEGIVHRDLKPNNLMISGRQVKISDFGLGLDKSFSTLQVYSQNDSFEYMAPECFDDPPQWSPMSDVYAIGIIMYEMITNHKPFHGKSRDDVKLMVQANERPTFDASNMKRNDGESKAIASFITLAEDCWSPDPEDRITSKQAYQIVRTASRVDRTAVLRRHQSVRDDGSSTHGPERSTKYGESEQDNEHEDDDFEVEENDYVTNALEEARKASNRSEVAAASLKLLGAMDRGKDRKTTRIQMLRGKILTQILKPWLSEYKSDEIVINTLRIFTFVVDANSKAKKVAIEQEFPSAICNLLSNPRLWHDARIVEVGCMALSSLTLYVKYAQELAEAGVPQILMDSIRTERHTESTYRSSCWAIGNLSRDPEVATWLIGANVVPLLLRIIWLDSEKSVEGAAFAFAHILTGDVEINNPDKKTPVVVRILKAVVGAMQLFPASFTIQRSCLYCIASGLENQEHNTKKIMSACPELYERIAFASKSHKRLDVQEATAAALRALLQYRVNGGSTAGVLKKILDSGVMDTLVKAAIHYVDKDIMFVNDTLWVIEKHLSLGDDKTRKLIKGDDQIQQFCGLVLSHYTEANNPDDVYVSETATRILNEY